MKKNKILKTLLIVVTMFHCPSAHSEGIQLIGQETKQLITNISKQGLMATFGPAHDSVERFVPENHYVGDGARTASSKELTNYLKRVEALNPGKNWQQIATRLHHYAYPYDSNYSMYDIPLFKEGTENMGWQVVQLPQDEDLPFFIRDDEGNLINFKHALSGLRASCNRKGSDRAIWMRVNTDLGDQYQVWNERKRIIENNSCALLPGATKSWVQACRDYTEKEDAITAGEYFSSLRKANRWYSEDQRRGNKLAFTLEKKLRKGTATNLSAVVEKTLID